MSTALTTQEQAALAQIEQEELMLSAEGVDFRPVQFKLNKDTCQFIDSLGGAHERLEGVIVYKHRVRGRWPSDEQRKTDNDKRPLCSSIDGDTGRDRDGNVCNCLNCPHNQWDTGKDGVGKACKEERWVYLVERGGSHPAKVRVTPGSLKGFDVFFSGRLQQRIPDIMVVTIMDSVPATGRGFTYAQIRFKSGARVTDIGEVMQYRKIREMIVKAVAQMEITEDDYPIDDSAPAAEQAQAGDVF